MKREYLTTIGFILVLSLVFGSLLAGVYGKLSPQIELNNAVAEKRAVLSAFAMDDKGTAKEVNQRFSEHIRQETIDQLEIYAKYDNSGAAQAYAVPFTGAGLWGTIRGFLAVTPDLKSVVGLTFTEQNETPGLGGRIDEEWFKEQFRNHQISFTDGFSYGQTDEGELDAITGATMTSNSVLRILNRLTEETLEHWEVP